MVASHIRKVDDRKFAKLAQKSHLPIIKMGGGGGGEGVPSRFKFFAQKSLPIKIHTQKTFNFFFVYPKNLKRIPEFDHAPETKSPPQNLLTKKSFKVFISIARLHSELQADKLLLERRQEQ